MELLAFVDPARPPVSMQPMCPHIRNRLHRKAAPQWHDKVLIRRTRLEWQWLHNSLQSPGTALLSESSSPPQGSAAPHVPCFHTARKGALICGSRVPELTAIRPQASRPLSSSAVPACPLHGSMATSRAHRRQQSWAEKDRQSPRKLEETCGWCLHVLYHCVPPTGGPYHNCPTEGWGRKMTGI